ncbi:MAG TPA: hypothetical protein VIK59_02950 [Verrucomicrobiae bacterium]
MPFARREIPQSVVKKPSQFAKRVDDGDDRRQFKKKLMKNTIQSNEARESGSKQTSSVQKTITRCKWCIKRIGEPSYKTENYLGFCYKGMHFVKIETLEEVITDGICPECFAIEKAKIEATKTKVHIC